MFPITIICYFRYHEVRKGNGSNIGGLLKQINETVKAMDGANPWGANSNQFLQEYTIGYYIAAVNFMKN